MREFDCAIYRGDTSKGIFFLEHNIPKREYWDKFLCEGMGGETKQIDGLGGGSSVTSKVAIIGKGKGCINYTFVQVSIDKEVVDYKSNCGNISAAVGPFAYNSGLIEDDMIVKEESDENHLCVRIYNTNTDKFIKSRFEIRDGRFYPYGDFHIAGVPNSASKIELSFLNPEGSLKKGLLPTNQAIQEIQTSFGNLNISIVDAGAALVFVRAKDVLSGKIFDDISHEELEKLEEIRGRASEILGLSSHSEARFKNPSIPKLALLDFPQDYVSSGNAKIYQHDSNISIRMMSMQKPHPAIAMTGTVCIAMASNIENTLVHSHVRNHGGSNLRISHPSGIIECGIRKDGIEIARTARRILEGKVFSRNDF